MKTTSAEQRIDLYPLVKDGEPVIKDMIGLALGDWVVKQVNGQKVTLTCGDETTTMSKGRFRIYYIAEHGKEIEGSS